jgi:hypothetical protein
MIKIRETESMGFGCLYYKGFFTRRASCWRLGIPQKIAAFGLSRRRIFILSRGDLFTFLQNLFEFYHKL